MLTIRRISSPSRAGGPLASIALAIALTLAPGADAADAAVCTHTQLPLDSVLTLSAAPAPDGDLLIVDLVSREVVELDLPGGSLRTLSGAPGEALKRLRPRAIRAFDGGLLVRQVSGGFVEMDQNLAVKPSPVRRLVGAINDDGLRLGGVALFEPADGRHLTTCSDVYLGSGDVNDPVSWATAMVRVPLDAPTNFEVLHRVDYNNDTSLACRLTLPVIATLGERSYLLTLDGRRAAIHEGVSGADSRRLNAFPAQFADLPALPLDPPRERIPALWDQIERATMPVAIYGWEGSLYVLSRSPGTNGTDWWLTRIDPVQDVETGTVRLGTRANHLLVVPGDQHWALIEKGPVESSFEDQDVTGILTVPAEQIRDWQPDRVLCGSAP